MLGFAFSAQTEWGLEVQYLLLHQETFDLSFDLLSVVRDCL